MNSPPFQTPCPAALAAPVTDARTLLLEEVDFKWLMAGLGWWINSERLHSDPDYAAGLLKLAIAAGSSALRDCAALLQQGLSAQCRCH